MCAYSLKRQQLGEDAIAYAHDIKLEALRLLGTMLQATKRNTGGEVGGKRPLAGSRKELANKAPTLADLGLDKKTSMLAFVCGGSPEFYTGSTRLFLLVTDIL